MRILYLLVVFLLPGPACAEDYLLPFEAPLPAATHPSLYSFADVYRLTVGGAAQGGYASDAQAPIRVAAQTPAPPEPRFLISRVPQDQRWLLLIAGLALAAWVAHRRLTSPF
jgi:hypothetical protein